MTKIKFLNKSAKNKRILKKGKRPVVVIKTKDAKYKHVYFKEKFKDEIENEKDIFFN